MLRSTREAGAQAAPSSSNNPDNTDTDVDIPPTISSATPNNPPTETEPVHKSGANMESEKQIPVLGKRKRIFTGGNGAGSEDHFQNGKRNRLTELLPPVATILTSKKVKQTTADDPVVFVEPVKKVVHIDPEVCEAVSQERTSSGTKSRKGRSPSPPPVLPPSPVFKKEQDRRIKREDITVTIKLITGSSLDFQFKPQASICALKEQIYWLTGIAPDRQVITIHGQNADNDYKTLQSFTPESQLNVQLSVKMFSGYNINNCYDLCDDLAWYSEEEEEGEGKDLVVDEKTLAMIQDTNGISLVQQINQLSLIEDITATPIRPPDTPASVPESQDVDLAKESQRISSTAATANPVYCSMCRVKCKLAMRFVCKHCLATFCPSHRYPDTHSCQTR